MYTRRHPFSLPRIHASSFSSSIPPYSGTVDRWVGHWTAASCNRRRLVPFRPIPPHRTAPSRRAIELVPLGFRRDSPGSRQRGKASRNYAYITPSLTSSRISKIRSWKFSNWTLTLESEFRLEHVVKRFRLRSRIWGRTRSVSRTRFFTLK